MRTFTAGPVDRFQRVIAPGSLPVIPRPSLLGAHVSIAGGTANAPPRAAAIGASAMQMFTKQANRWADRECEGDECEVFRGAVSAAGVERSAAHDSYLINLASPDPVLRAKSIESFRCELRRCETLGIDLLVSHPGNYMDDRANGLARNSDAIIESLEQTPGRTMLLLETTAGQGTVLGATFEELAELLDRLPPAVAARVAVCADTAHLFGAGYDLVDDFDGVWARFDDTLGMARLRMLHLNDSKVPLGSRKDRHELIGEGAIGSEPFRRLMTDARFALIPKVIETPKLDDAEITDRRMLDLLRAFEAGR